jgi:hypothetical protein
MTGTTGSLTPDNADEDFVPAETRAMTDPKRANPHEPEPTPGPVPSDVGSILGGDERREPEEEHL